MLTRGQPPPCAACSLRYVASTDRPWFVMAGFRRPHLPWRLPQAIWDMYDGESSLRTLACESRCVIHEFTIFFFLVGWLQHILVLTTAAIPDRTVKPAAVPNMYTGMPEIAFTCGDRCVH